MDTQIIQEIANQLGIAADRIATEIIPQYAQMQIFSSIFNLVGSLILFSIFAWITYILYKKYKNVEEEYGMCSSKYEAFLILSIVSGFITAIALIIFIVILFSAPEMIYNWVNFPETMFIKTLLN